MEEAPRLVFWVDIDLAIREGLTFHQTRSNAIFLQGTLPACCIVRAERLRNGEKLYEKQYLSPRPPPKISLKHDLNWSKGNDQGSTVEQQPVGKLAQQSFGEAPRVKLSKPTQSKPNPICDRSGKPEDKERVLWIKEKRPVPKRSMINVCMKNLALQIEQAINTIYRIIQSVNQLSLYGAVAAKCDEYESHQGSTGQPVILVGQSIVLGEIKAEVPFRVEEPRDDQIILQQYVQQVESLSPENRVSKFCKEAGFMRVVEVGQCFVTRNASEFQHTVACREYTLPRDDPASEPKVCIRGNMRIGPILEVTTSFQHFKYGIEIRIESVNKDNSQSWVRISYGTVRYVNDYIKYNTQSLADPQEEEDVPTSSGVVAARSKAKAKPQPRESTGTTTIPLSERIWIDIEPSKQDLESYNLSKKVVNLLRHNQKLHREEDGAIQFYKIKFHLRDYPLPIQNWSDDRWLACLAAGGGPKRRYQYCSDYLGSIIYLRALQGHSGDSIIDLAMQDHVLISPGIFSYIYHVGCTFNLYSILSNGLIPGGQILSRRQTVFFLPVDPRNEDHKDPEYIDVSVPRLARYLHSAWKKHQDAVFWVDINLAMKEGLTFYQTRSNAIILQGTLPAYFIPKIVRLKTGEVLYEKSYMSPRPPPKISLRHDHDWTRGNVQLGSTVDQQPEGKVVRQSRGEVQHATFSQLTQPIPKPICDRSGQPEDTQVVFIVKSETSRSHEIDEKGLHEKLCASDRSGQLEITLSVIEARNLCENMEQGNLWSKTG